MEASNVTIFLLGILIIGVLWCSMDMENFTEKEMEPCRLCQKAFRIDCKVKDKTGTCLVWNHYYNMVEACKKGPCSNIYKQLDKCVTCLSKKGIVDDKPVKNMIRTQTTDCPSCEQLHQWGCYSQNPDYCLYQDYVNKKISST